MIKQEKRKERCTSESSKYDVDRGKRGESSAVSACRRGEAAGTAQYQSHPNRWPMVLCSMMEPLVGLCATSTHSGMRCGGCLARGPFTLSLPPSRMGRVNMGLGCGNAHCLDPRSPRGS
jgi:hypothetical protein